MLLRRTAPLAVALAALACEPSVPSGTNPTTVDYAAFDPQGDATKNLAPDIPLPNALALLPQAIATQNPAQQALLNAFVAAGGFPNDQEVPITIDFVRETIDPATGAATRVAPPLNVSTITASTVVVMSISSSGFGPVAFDAPVATDYQVIGDHGQLTLHKSANAAKSGTRAWDPGTYVVAVRGGPNGVQMTDGTADGVQPQAAMYLLTHCCTTGDLTSPQNQGIIPGDTRQAKADTAAQLELIRKQYLLPFGAIDASGKFAHTEVATMTVFQVAPATTHVLTDPSAGELPLPSDFLLGADGHLLPALASSSGPFSALGPGLATLDGFSTTAMILAPVSSPIQGGTVNANTVFLVELNLTGTPSATRILDVNAALGAGQPAKANYVTEPPQIQVKASDGTSACPGDATPCISTAIGLQPAVPVQLPAAAGGGFLPVPPLKEGTHYAVIVTDGVKDLNNAALSRSTLSRVLLMDPTLHVSVGGKSQLAGVSDGDAAGLEQMRGAINLALTAVPTVTRDHVAMAYTFRTQTMKSTAVSLAALPYNNTTNPADNLAPVGTPKVYCNGANAANPLCPAADGDLATLFGDYGLDTTIVPSTHIGKVIEAQIKTYNMLSDTTGAFNPTPQLTGNETITALISLPSLATLSGCNPAVGQLCTIPLVVYRHGLGGGRGDMLTLADAFNAQGVAVAAIDAAKHGDRSFCATNAECASGGTCNHIAAMANQGDAAGAGPGKCSTDFIRKGIVCPTGGTCPAAPSKGRPVSSSQFFIGANLFRTRDTVRQDIIDESHLIRVLSPNPLCDPTAIPTDTAHTCASLVFSALSGIQIDKTRIWMAGQSLGAMGGVIDAAANPRVSKVALSVGGGTMTDVFTNSPSFASAVGGLLATLHITAGTPAYLQFINVAKWALDPADPLNYVTNLSANTLPSPLSGNVAPPARKVMAQLSNCDQTVPNPFNLEMDELSGLLPAASGTAKLEVFTFAGNYTSIGQPSCRVQTGATTFASVPEAVSGGGSVPHSILTSWGLVSGTQVAGLKGLTADAQLDIANFFVSDTTPPADRDGNAP